VQTAAEVELIASNAAAADDDGYDDYDQYDDDDEDDIDETDDKKENIDNSVLSVTELLAESRRDRVQSRLVFSSLGSCDLFL